MTFFVVRKQRLSNSGSFDILGKVAELPTVTTEDPAPVRIGDVDSEDEDVAIRLQALRS
jgi:hypothetical protein